ncbi:MAG TPA: PGPGW domain-containing protein [Candidatus Nanopelagicales bacterium]|nr:PGPGW domain-containing protein [Candidatus Nanopelagicales bacterium]
MTAPADAPTPESAFARLAARAPWRRLPHPLRWLTVAVLGTTSLLIGALLLVLPGPGLAFMALGLAILATEFVWAETLLTRATNKGRQGWHKARSMVTKPATSDQH